LKNLYVKQSNRLERDGFFCVKVFAEKKYFFNFDILMK